MWHRVITGVCIVVAGLVLQLAMVTGAVTPGLALALAGYAALFIGMLVSLAGILRVFRSEKQATPQARDNPPRLQNRARRARHRG